MFTLKFYSADGCRMRVVSAESLTILKSSDNSDAEITLHQKNPADDFRVDIVPQNTVRAIGWPPDYQKAIIENASGRTTEIICASPALPKAA